MNGFITMRVAVVYFGIARGTSITAEGIQRHVIDCNRRLGVELTTFASLNLVDRIDNMRTGEIGVHLDPDEALVLHADNSLLVPQDDAAIASALAASKRHPDFYDDHWTSVKNALHQLASLHRAWREWADRLQRFDYILFLRPDLLYLEDIRLTEIAANFREAGSIAVPSWHSWGGFNDRFAFADPIAARHFAERLNLVPRYCAASVLHPECLLAYALRLGRCKVGALPVHARRVRAHGAIQEENFDKTPLPLPSRPAPFSFVGQVRLHSRLQLLLQIPYGLDLWRSVKEWRARLKDRARR